MKVGCLVRSVLFLSRNLLTNSFIIRMLGNEITEPPQNVFTQRFNPMTGKIEWEIQDENYDYHQEIARSAYADMLHDTERNKKYFAGLKCAIDELRTKGQPVRVLDIGTGTGLLSLMAAQLGADEITACEAFAPMAACARQVIKQNGFEDKIHLIPKRSTEITVGQGCDMTHRANILVTEVFDTELIGEGAISTFNHAHQHLLEKNCLTVPSRATVYAQIVESPLLWSWKCPKPLTVEKCQILLPEDIHLCHGSNAVLDLQLSQLPTDSFHPLSDSIPVIKFDFTGVDLISQSEHCRVKVTLKNSGRCEVIFFWWDIEMDSKGAITLSCAPWWSHQLGKQQPWRDHWMQAVYYPSKPIEVLQGETIILDCFHDEYSFWFDIQSEAKRPDTKTANEIARPICMCGFHNICNPNRIGMISDRSSSGKYLSALSKLIKENTICAYIGNGGSLLPLMAAKLGAKKVYVIDSEHFSVKVLHTLIQRNNLDNEIKVLDKPVEELNTEDFEQNKVDVFLSEAYFLNSLLPWHDLHFWYAINKLSHFKMSFSRSVPKLGKLWGMGMHFLHLWKIKAPLNVVEGFKMDIFDDVIKNSSNIADHTVEPHPLWEYEGLAMTDPFLIYTFDMDQILPQEILTASDSISLLSDHHCNGVAIWMEWILDEDSINRGPIVQPTPGQKVQWNMTSKQGVYFLPSVTNTITCKHLIYQISFNAKVGSFEFNFLIK